MQDQQAIINLLQKIPCTRGMSEPQLMILSECVTVREFHTGEIILNEGELSDELFAIVSGSVQLLKFDKHKREQFVLGELGAESEFGEFAFLDGSPRSCTIRALRETSLVVISKHQLLANELYGQQIIDRISLNVSAQLSKKMRSTDVSYVDILQQQIISLNNRVQFSRLFVLITVFLGLSNIFIEVLSHYETGLNVRTFLFSWSYLFILFLPVLYLVVSMRKPPSTFGLTLHNARKSIVEALIIIAMLAPVIIYLSGDSFADVAASFFSPLSAAYIAHSAIQEFIARGVIQTTISKFMFDRANLMSIFLASFYFGIFHLHFGMEAFGLTFLFGLLFGYIFYRQKNLLGVTLVHYVLGWIALGKFI